VTDTDVAAPLADGVAEARRILAAGSELPLRLLGGLAIELAAGGSTLLPRPYKDIDFITVRGRGPQAADLFEQLGYAGDQTFNGLHGHRRLLFYDLANERRVDVFVGQFQMCHVLPLADRLRVAQDTIPLADLLLTKLQIFSLNEKDQRDVLNLVHGHKLAQSEEPRAIDTMYVARLCAADWGLWRTVTLNLERTRGALSRYPLAPEQEALVTSRIDDLRRRIDDEPKSLRWKMRARVGERVKWYEEPEEVD
jgi:hypothetical protein